MVIALRPNTMLCSNYEALISTTLLQPENVCCKSIREARNSLAKKILMKGQVILKLKKKVMYPVHTSECRKVCTKHGITTVVPMPVTSRETTCYPIQQDYGYPIPINDWQSMNSTSALPLFTVQNVPVILQRISPIFATHTCPLAGGVVEPVISPIPLTFAQEDLSNVCNYINEYNYSTDHTGVTEVENEQAETLTHLLEDTTTFNNNIDLVNSVNPESQYDPIQLYLALPKKLFPTARMLGLDPNPMINEFCKIANLHEHTPWLLDLEFGIPKSPITRPIPFYNVKFNSIHCKNAPDAIHPGFESCEPDFKKVLLFYYDCIVSAWYRGYIIMNCDRSVENFQSWLLLPMQVLGMCWP